MNSCSEMYIYGITVENVKIMFVVISMWAQSFCPPPPPTKHWLESRMYMLNAFILYLVVCTELESRSQTKVYMLPTTTLKWEHCDVHPPPPPTSPCVWAGGLHNKHVSVSVSVSLSSPRLVLLLLLSWYAPRIWMGLKITNSSPSLSFSVCLSFIPPPPSLFVRLSVSHFSLSPSLPTIVTHFLRVCQM